MASTTVETARYAKTLQLQAFATYIHHMREALGLKVKDVRLRMRNGPIPVSIDGKDIWEFERAQRMPGDRIRKALIAALDLDPQHIDAIVAYGVETAAQGSMTGGEQTLEAARAYGMTLVQQRLQDRATRTQITGIVHEIPPEELEQALAIVRELYAKSPDRAKEYLALGTFFLNKEKP